MFNLEATTHYYVDGQEVSADRFAGHIGEMALVAQAEEMAASVRDLRCPEHGAAPEIEVHYSGSGEAVKMRFKSCCEALDALVTKKRMQPS